MSEQITPITPRLEPRAEDRNGSGIKSGNTKRPWYSLRLGPTAALAVIALAALVAWLVFESRSSDSATGDNVPVVLSADGLATLAAAVPQPIYWVGPTSSGSYELTRSLDRTYVRYLPAGVSVGESRPFLTIGTYAMADAYQVMEKTFATPGNPVIETPKGGIAVIDQSRPTSVYVAYPNTDFQIEIYSPRHHPSPRLRGHRQGAPVTETTLEATGPVVTTPAALKALADSVGRPVYWAGAQPNTTLELTQTTNGRTSSATSRPARQSATRRRT